MIVEIKKIKIRQFRYAGHLIVTFKFNRSVSKSYEKKVIFSMANFLIENRKNNLNTNKDICDLIGTAREQGSLNMFYCSSWTEEEKKQIFKYVISNL